MHGKLIGFVILLMMNDVCFSLISEKEWVSLCRNATGEREYTCLKLKAKLGISSSKRSENWDKVYKKMVHRQHLALCSLQISDLSPLAGFTNLRELELSDNEISNLSSLSELSSLRKIDLCNNQISDLTPLAGLSNLQTIFLVRNSICDISPLAELSDLRVLLLNDNNLSELSSLTRLSRLRELYLDNNEIYDISPLAAITNLVQLNLRGNFIHDFSPISHIEKVEGNQIQNKLNEFQLINRLPEEQEVNDEKFTCAICLNQYKAAEDLSEIDLEECRHVFHKICLGAWLKKHDTCPFCRAAVPRKY